jgi:hypothetical protein
MVEKISNNKTIKDKPPALIRKIYLENDFFTNKSAIRSMNYKKYKFSFKKKLNHQLSLKYP